MYKTIYVPVDNSDYSNQAVASAVRLGRAFESKLVGCHVYAAKMHDYRFKQMEYTLPDEYLDETELERQRQIHDSLITMGLELISDSYLDQMKTACEQAGLEFEPKMMDGKHHVEIVRDIRESGYDLTVLGVMGMGRVRDSQIGSVCERVARCSERDVLVIKRLPDSPAAENAAGNAADSEAQRDTILVGVDGSPQSFGALVTAIELAKRFGKTVEAISVYDPYLHYSVFNGVVNVLTEKAAKVFRFEEQNQLHEEIIDTGLAQIYQSHLDVAATMARKEHEVEVKKTLLDGKAFQKILDHARKVDPWLLIIGRIGVHSDKGEPGLGSNAENLLRSCPCDLLLTTRLEYPELDLKAEQSIRWTPEAEERLKRVPTMVKGIARTAILRLALEKGHSVVSNAVIDEAMDRYMPKATSRQTEKLAETLAIARARTQPTSICKCCGVTAKEAEPVRCGVCGAGEFELITAEMIERIAAAEGGLSEEATYDGRKLKWTQDGKRALWTMKDAYKRRRVKARVEKSARMKRMPAVTLDFARGFIEEETGAALELPRASEAGSELETPATDPRHDKKLIARDTKKNPLLSTHEWTHEAVERLFRVPVGYMRDRTQGRAEALAVERSADRIDLGHVEDGIEHGRRLMEQLLAEREAAGADGAKSADATSAAPVAPHSDASGSGVSRSSGKTKERGEPLYLNEVGLMSRLQGLRADGAGES